MRKENEVRWCRFRHDGKDSFGIVEGDEIHAVAGSPFGRHRRTRRRLPLREVKLLVPCIPGTFYAAGLNYADHAVGMGALMDKVLAPPAAPYVTYRTSTALIAHEEPIVIPADASEEVQYEGELVVVIGKTAKHLSEANALDCVLGYTIGNDFSERSWQRSDPTFWRAKNSDTFKPMGPWIETDVDLDNMQTTVRVNGRVATRFATNRMIFGVATYLSAMSRYVTLHPGDVLWMGTDQVPENVEAGDVVEVEVTGIGVLRNPVTRAGA
jgi:2-keto-4-pentenoate hydratase/2-oxohepta-3-ene-1,7-dioic acid hydratase in catechol pathway